MNGRYVGPAVDLDAELVDLLDLWHGSARVWQLVAGLDNPDDFDAVLLDAIVLGAVEYVVDGGHPDEDRVVLTEAWR